MLRLKEVGWKMIDSFFSILKMFWVGIVTTCIVIVIMVAVFITAVERNKEWETFKTKHNCKLIERMSGSTSNWIRLWYDHFW